MDVRQSPVLVAGVPGHVHRPHGADVERGPRRHVQRRPVNISLNTSGLIPPLNPGRLLTARPGSEGSD